MLMLLATAFLGGLMYGLNFAPDVFLVYIILMVQLTARGKLIADDQEVVLE